MNFILIIFVKGLEALMKFGYLVVIVTMFLMIWASLSSAKEIDEVNYPPCIFNPLCSCSKTYPDLGVVQCRDMPFPSIPRAINNSKVYSLAMENTGLISIEPFFLQATGKQNITIFV